MIQRSDAVMSGISAMGDPFNGVEASTRGFWQIGKGKEMKLPQLIQNLDTYMEFADKEPIVDQPGKSGGKRERPHIGRFPFGSVRVR